MSSPPIIEQFLEEVYNHNHRPLIMGIINVTPDSFYSASSGMGISSLHKAMSYISEGADILDIGGESTRPGSVYISAEEEMDRIVPVIELVRRESDIPISVDTRKCEVAREAVKAGANCINDISALRDDPQLGSFIAEKDLPVILMHMQGTPAHMQDNLQYHDVVLEVKEFLQERIDYALKLGISCEHIIIDPGIGFGKNLGHNLRLLNNLEDIVAMGFPVLIGHSRKSFIGKILGTVGGGRKGTILEAEEQPRSVFERLYGSLAVVADSYIRGARIFRVHDVPETRDVVETIYRIRNTE
ncbi:MAG: dihydropteroate synthase [Salinispira sp.]